MLKYVRLTLTITKETQINADDMNDIHAYGKKLELLSPAADETIAIEAIKHGADAVYMGGPSHGARKSASNTLDSIARVVDFAHSFRARVYVTVNTIVYQNEIRAVESLCRDLYHAGVDALIVQDMGLLRMKLPPVALHASTQCDIRTPEKAVFLEKAGFSQLVLARELTLGEIREITSSVSIPVECFVHGALCVSYSGRCHASCAATGRSANRGECAQICRLPFTLTDSAGRVMAKDKHLLSLKDFNASGSLEELVDAGVSSFKIEGRLKGADYVKNITAFYSGRLDRVIREKGSGYRRSSFGEVSLGFTPSADKSFNRGFTDYFLHGRRPLKIASLDTPKSMGETISDIGVLHNGDGISYFNSDGEYVGVNINKVENGNIVTARKTRIPRNAVIHRTYDIEWQKRLARESAVRKIAVDVSLDDSGVTARDERGVAVRLALDVTKDVAKKAMDYSADFSKLGNTVYSLRKFSSSIDSMVFIPKSEVTRLRRELTAALDMANLSTYRYDTRRPECVDAPYPSEELDFRDNVANSLAESFYRDHGVRKIGKAMETEGREAGRGRVVMTTRHCILRELGICRKEKGDVFSGPLVISNGALRFQLRFNCRDCEMEVLSL